MVWTMIKLAIIDLIRILNEVNEMKKLRCVIMIMALTTMFIFPINSLAEINEANLNQNENSSEQNVKNEDNNTVEESEPASNIEINSNTRVKSPSAMKTFTVTKYPVGNPGNEELVGEYDTFYSAVDNCKQEQLGNQYVITMNKDYNVPADEAMWSRSNVNIIIKSREGNKFTLKREGTRDLISINNNATLKFKDIVLDGNNQIELISALANAVLTLDKGSVVQNCKDSTHFDGPAIYLSGASTLNIEDGAIIRNNNGSSQGGAIASNSETSTINIRGGIFEDNSCEKYGGAIATWGKLNITGGTFRNNSAIYGGAIASFKKANTSIENAIFEGNSASQGGAVISWNEIKVKNSSFNDNEANWGGAIFAKDSIDLTNINFAKNKVAKQGGALYLGSGNPKVTDCVFNGNLSNLQGGAIYIDTANTTINDSEFKENGSGKGGGSILINHDNKGITKISKTSFTDNYSNAFGGGVYLGLNSKLEVTDSSFKNNQAAYGAGISSAGNGDVDKELTNIKVEKTNFTGNKSLMGGGIYTAFPTEVFNSTFSNNEAIVSKNDEETNPHFSGVGGAMEIIDNKTVIKESTFRENTAGGSGGAIGINGVIRDDEGKITGIKKNIKVEISDNTKFISNLCKAGQGGAIYTIPYLYDLGGQEISDGLLNDFKAKAYKNLTTENTTLFRGNKSESGLFFPPENYKDFTNLEFSKGSDVPHKNYMPKSLINNYDINYKSDYRAIIYDSNGGEFADGKVKIIEKHKVNDEIKLKEAPIRDGYEFKYWESEGNQYTPGDLYKVKGDATFVAKWEKIDKSELKDSNAPNTGDSEKPLTYILVVIIAVLALALAIIIKKRHDK